MKGLLLQPLLRLFSSVTFGISLMALLFLYMTVGSAGILYPVHPNLFHPDAWVHAQMRQWRPFEMTEFEWFHWWPFNALVLLIAITMVVTTLRRIAFKPVNYGVWMIHTGVITLIIGSVIYFGTKIEGEAPIPRRTVKISLAPTDSEPAATGSLVAMPGNRTVLNAGSRQYDIEVRSIDPAWELLSGPDKGVRAYSVNLLIQGPERRFIRQVIAGYPQYTEDLILTQDKAQPVKRAVKELGKPLVDDALSVELDYQGQPWFYLKNDLNKSWALYVRRPGQTEWVERPAPGLPLYNDYISSTDQVFGGAESGLRADAIRVAVPAVAANDPAPNTPLDVTGFLRYAQLRSRWKNGTAVDAENPVALVAVASPEGERPEFRLIARDSQQRSALGGSLVMREVTAESQVEPLMREPTIVFSIPSANLRIEEKVRDAVVTNADLPFKSIGPKELGYSYRVSSVQDDLPIAGQELSVAILEMRTPKGEFRRWAFSDSALSRDMAPGQSAAQAAAHGAQSFLDHDIRVEYQPGNGLALVTLVVGPEQSRLRLIDSLSGATPRILDLEQGQPVDLGGKATVTVTAYMPRAVLESKPLPVPAEQRIRDARELFAMVQVNGGNTASEWLKYHPYVFDRPEEVLKRYWLEPSLLTLGDGSTLEVLFSRQRQRLPTTVALQDFVLDTNVGGFSGATASIRNYTSIVRFKDQGGDWGAPLRLSVNEPVEHLGYWFFQSQWDPPEESRQGGLASAGLNYTVLGVGNRQGVYLQLAGCIVAVLGMAYAFYVKPIIKRKHARAVLQEIADAKTQGRRPTFGARQEDKANA